MNPERLLQNFDRLIDTPDAVPRLRRFILDLAVRGKLVEQNPEDEPASELLKRIEVEKRKISGRRKTENETLAAIDKAEEPFALPRSWRWSQATEPAILISDNGKKIQTKDVLESGTYPVVDQGKVFIRGYSDDADKVVHVDGPIIIFGDHTRETKMIDFDFVVGADGVKLLKPLQIDPAYYFLALQWVPLESRGYARHFKLLREALIPIPPLAEQHRIVAKVEELMKLCYELEAAQAKRERRRDRLVAATLHGLNGINVSFPLAGNPSEERLRTSRSDISFEDSARFYFNHLPRLTTRPEHIQQLRQTIRNLAVRGKLVMQDPKEESVAELLKKIEAEKASFVKEVALRKQKHLTLIEEDAIPFKIPSTWRWMTLGNLTISMANGIYKPDSFYSDDGVLCLRMYNIRNGTINFDSSKRVLVDDKELKAYELQPGDLLVNRVNSRELVGKAGVIPKTSEKLIFESKNIRLRLVDLNGLPRYCNLLFQTTFFRNIIEGHSKQACGQATVSQPQLSTLPVPLPPLAEQHRIVAKVDELMKLCNELEAEITNTTSTRRQLIEVTLHEALRGYTQAA